MGTFAEMELQAVAHLLQAYTEAEAKLPEVTAQILALAYEFWQLEQHYSKPERWEIWHKLLEACDGDIRAAELAFEVVDNLEGLKKRLRNKVSD